jgi:hypothetical protein
MVELRGTRKNDRTQNRYVLTQIRYVTAEVKSACQMPDTGHAADGG